MKESANTYLIENIPYYREPIILACKEYDITLKQLISKSRKREIMLPRQILMMYWHKVLRLNSTESGQPFNKDHATVLHACKMVKNMVHTDKDYKIKLRQFCQECKKLKL